jgi:hypothetical protein
MEIITGLTLLRPLNVQIKKGGSFRGLILYFYKLKCKIVNIFMGFCVDKIKVPRGIGQHPIESGPYDPYVI